MTFSRILMYFFFCLLFLTGCTTKPLESTDQEETIPVRVENVKKDTFSLRLELSGLTKVKQDFPVFTPSPLPVEEVYVQLGEEVKQGDKLLLFANPELEEQLQEVQQQISNLEKNINDMEKIELEMQEQAGSQSVESLERAQAILNGTQTGAVTMLDLLEASTQLLLMQNQLQLGNSSSLALKPQLLMQLEQAKAQLRMTEKAIEQLTIQAPFDGVITGVNIAANEIALPNTPLLQLSNLEDIIVDVQVGSTHIQQLEQGMKAWVWLNDSTKPIEAKLDALSPGPALQRNTYQAQILLDNKERRLFPAQFVTVEVETEHIEDALLVPVQAVFFQDDRAFVYTVQNQKAARTEITIGQRNRDKYQVLSGLSEQDIVITAGLERVTDGSMVYIQK